ncbi:hypothetical protein [Hymenobacter edaphi]|uniref:hypothetical protein n=1 Tax=Hymenobacter edaphi TaxID=2211146 RepID=UPI001057BA4C|nr:hypothetical protein [Hymenobacter edaphi]
MKNILWPCGLVCLVTGCFFSDFKEGPFPSPSGAYAVVAKVNRMHKERDDYADVKLLLLNREKQVIDSVNSKAGDASKWAAGWMPNGDTVVLYSADIGSKAWSIKDNHLREINLYADTLKCRVIMKRANALKIEKYSQ